MNFAAAFTKLVDPQHEGAYSNVPGDRGGETYVGISRVENPAWNGWALVDKHRCDPTFPKSLGADPALSALAESFYDATYWTPAGCDAVPDVLKFDLFDMAVNQGVSAAVKALQHAVGVTEDGALGPMTIQAAQAALPVRLLFRFDAARLVHYAENTDAQLLQFGRGWLRRVATNMNGY